MPLVRVSNGGGSADLLGLTCYTAAYSNVVAPINCNGYNSIEIRSSTSGYVVYVYADYACTQLIGTATYTSFLTIDCSNRGTVYLKGSVSSVVTVYIFKA